MEIAPLPSKLTGADVPLERLAGSSNLSEEQKIGEASRQFEAVLLRQILTETQKPVFTSKLTDTSTAGGIYRDMVTSQLSDSISKSGALGLSQTLNQQLNHQVLPHAKDGKAASAATNTPPAVTEVNHSLSTSRPIARVIRANLNNIENINTAH